MNLSIHGQLRQSWGISLQRRLMVCVFCVISVRAVRHASSMTDGRLEALLTGFAEFYLSNPLRLENLCSRQAAGGMGVQDGVYDVATAGLEQY